MKKNVYNGKNASLHWKPHWSSIHTSKICISMGKRRGNERQRNREHHNKLVHRLNYIVSFWYFNCFGLLLLLINDIFYSVFIWRIHKYLSVSGKEGRGPILNLRIFNTSIFYIFIRPSQNFVTNKIPIAGIFQRKFKGSLKNAFLLENPRNLK